MGLSRAKHSRNNVLGIGKPYKLVNMSHVKWYVFDGKSFDTSFWITLTDGASMPDRPWLPKGKVRDMMLVPLSQPVNAHQLLKSHTLAVESAGLDMTANLIDRDVVAVSVLFQTGEIAWLLYSSRYKVLERLHDGWPRNSSWK